MDTIAQVAGCYAEYFGRMVGHGVDLPQRATRSEYSDDIAKDYPFDPELLTTLNRKTSTIPNFQRTRGVLRLVDRCWYFDYDGLRYRYFLSS